MVSRTPDHIGSPELVRDPHRALGDGIVADDAHRRGVELGAGGLPPRQVSAEGGLLVGEQEDGLGVVLLEFGTGNLAAPAGFSQSGGREQQDNKAEQNVQPILSHACSPVFEDPQSVHIAERLKTFGLRSLLKQVRPQSPSPT
jgi:hypothetical protein